MALFRRLLFVVFIVVAVMTGITHAAVITISTSTPSVSGADIANLGARTGGSLIWSDRPMQGQTFTTGSNIGGYQLSSLTFIMVDNDASPTSSKAGKTGASGSPT